MRLDTDFRGAVSLGEAPVEAMYSGAKLVWRNLPRAIRRMFANNEAGAFYDPSDLSTLYTEWEGTLTTRPEVGNELLPVGTMLDKRRELGPEILTGGALPNTSSITNVGGSSGSWNAATQTLANSVVGSNSQYPRFYWPVSATVGATYRIAGKFTTRPPSSDVAFYVIGESLASNRLNILSDGSFNGLLTITQNPTLGFGIRSNGTTTWSVPLEYISLR
jgi:hypothetical protein